jgi:hypothetical protein
MKIYSLMPDVKRYQYQGLGSLALSEGEIRQRL